MTDSRPGFQTALISSSVLLPNADSAGRLISPLPSVSVRSVAKSKPMLSIGVITSHYYHHRHPTAQRARSRSEEAGFGGSECDMQW